MPLVRSIRDPDAPALGSWSVAQLATHLSHGLSTLVPRLAAGEAAPPLDSLWHLSRSTQDWVTADVERDPQVLADRIEAGVAGFLALVPEGTPDRLCEWVVTGSEMPLSTFTCHLLNEALVHGWDLARAVGRPWPLERPYAVMAIMGFIIPVLQRHAGPEAVDQAAAGDLRAVYDVRLKGGGGRAYFVLDAGTLSVELPSDRRVDCHILADPATMLLIAWGRKSQWPAIATGRLLAYGRKPWLGPRLRTAVRTP